MIGEAFVNCQNLRKVELPDSLEYIGRRAFASCRLNSIRVRGIHTTFDDRIFENNHSQELIVYLNPNCRKIRLSAFEGIRNLVVVSENEELLSKFSGINNTKAMKAPYDEDLVR